MKRLTLRGGPLIAAEPVASGGMIDAPPASCRGPWCAWCAESGLTKGLAAGRFTPSKRPCPAGACASPMGHKRTFAYVDRLLSVVEDDAYGVPQAAADAADAMPEID